jgi:putative transposase
MHLAETSGRKLRLNRAILDQGWYTFRTQLAYKLAWAGGQLVAIPPQNTSRECPACHHVSADNRKTQAQFLCVKCGLEANADHVGAINVLSRWLRRDEGQDTAHACAGRETAARIACEVNGARGRQQQEPAEETVSE